MSETLATLRAAIEAETLVALAPITLLTRPVGLAWALLTPGHRPLLETRWFTAERRGVLAPQVARLERLAREAAQAADLGVRLETTDERRVYEELAPLLRGRVSIGDDLARRRADLSARALAFGIPLDLRASLDLQDAAGLLLETGLLEAPGASLSSLNSRLPRPVPREPFDSAVGRLAASISAWTHLIAPAALHVRRIPNEPTLAQ